MAIEAAGHGQAHLCQRQYGVQTLNNKAKALRLPMAGPFGRMLVYLKSHHWWVVVSDRPG